MCVLHSLEDALSFCILDPCQLHRNIEAAYLFQLFANVFDLGTVFYRLLGLKASVGKSKMGSMGSVSAITLLRLLTIMTL